MSITYLLWGFMYPKEYMNLRFRIADLRLG
jgi:hypothetical protein